MKNHTATLVVEATDTKTVEEVNLEFFDQIVANLVDCGNNVGAAGVLAEIIKHAALAMVRLTEAAAEEGQ